MSGSGASSSNILF
jgi:hypothetical protein